MCKHKWKVLESFGFDSIIENLCEIRDSKLASAPSCEMESRGVISIVECKNCGKIKHIKAKIKLEGL